MRWLLLSLFLTVSTLVSAQNNQLAQQYYLDGEYEKSAELYLALAKEKPSNSFYFDRYVTSLLKLQRFDEAEDALKKQLRKRPEEVWTSYTSPSPRYT